MVYTPGYILEAGIDPVSFDFTTLGIYQVQGTIVLEFKKAFE
jgi:hypothetical protein